jgi:hypothetical protein
VRNIQRRENNQNRTLAPQGNQIYNIYEANTPEPQNNERSFEHERIIELSDGGRLQPAEPERTGGKPGNPWQIRVAPKTVSETAPENPVHEYEDNVFTIEFLIVAQMVSVNNLAVV